MVAHDCLGGLVDLVRSTAGTPPPSLAHSTAPCATCHAMQHISLRLRVCTDILDSGPLTPARLSACARALSVGVRRLRRRGHRPPAACHALSLGLSLTSCHTTVHRSLLMPPLPAAHGRGRTRLCARTRWLCRSHAENHFRAIERRIHMRPGRFIHVCVLSPAPLLTRLLTHSSCASLACPHPSLVII